MAGVRSAIALALLVGCLGVAPEPDGASSEAPPPAHPNVLVIDIDTLTASRVGQVRDGASVTPTIDALAARGTRFSHAYSQAGWTLPALTALLTGRYPMQVRPEDGHVTWRPPTARDVGGILSMYGYDTAAFFGETVPGPMMRGVLGGFARFQEGTQGARGADVDAWLANDAKEPFFAFVHEVDLHVVDFATPAEAVHRFEEGPVGCERGGHTLSYRRYAQRHGEARAAEHVIAHYDGVLNWYDGILAGHLRALEARGIADRTIVVITSDHGEDLFVHAWGDHGPLYDTVIQVPLVIVDPRESGGRVVEEMVQTVDVAPTLLALADVPLDAAMDGRSLAAAVRGGAAPDERPVFSLTNRANASVRTGRWKLLTRDAFEAPTTAAAGLRWTPADAASSGEVLALIDAQVASTETDAGQYAQLGPAGEHPGGPLTGGIRPEQTPERRVVELYDLAADPEELTNVLDANPAVARELATALGAWLAAREPGRRQGPPVDPALEQKLQDAGYWGLIDEETTAPR